MADLKIQGEVVVDASQAESALDRVGSKAESMAAEVGQSAGQAGRAVDGIGDKAEITTRFTIAVDLDIFAKKHGPRPARNHRGVGAVRILTRTEHVEIPQTDR